MTTTPDTFTSAGEDHPFARYVRILGKGKSGTRSLNYEEAQSAFNLILQDQVDPVQLGAFLMLLRVKEETGEELAGFITAVRQNMPALPGPLVADLDWSSYAGKKHQHPWFALSIVLLTEAGYRIFVHGSDGHTQGRLYTEQVFEQLGLPIAQNWQQVSNQLDQQNLSYMPLRCFCPALHQMMQLRPLLGLRSPVNTLARMLNPLAAPASIQSVFHPAYASLHQSADKLMQQPRALVFKGDSGEVEVKPQADTRLSLLHQQDTSEVMLQRSIEDRVPSVTLPQSSAVLALWQDDVADEYGLAATLSTTTAALLLLEPDLAIDDAHRRAKALWQTRNRQRFTPCP